MTRPHSSFSFTIIIFFTQLIQTENVYCLLILFFTNLLTDFAKALLRVMRNWIVISLMFADHMLSFSSFPDGTYASKYLQYEFHLSAADASAIRGKKKRQCIFIHIWLTSSAKDCLQSMECTTPNYSHPIRGNLRKCSSLWRIYVMKVCSFGHGNAFSVV